MFRKLSLVAVACALLACAASTPARQSKPLTLDEVLAKHFAARGGLEKIKAIQSLKMTGTTTVQGMQLPMTMIIKRPGAFRMEMAAQGKSFVQAFDGTTGWMVNPFMGSSDAQKAPDEVVDDLKNQADLDGALIDPQAKGFEIELVGKEDFEGTPVYKIKLTRKNGDTTHVFIDAETFLELKSTMRRTRDGKTVEVEAIQADYKPVAGVLVPYTVEAKADGNTVFSFTATTIEANTAVDDAIFKMPAPAAAPAPAAKP